MTQPSPFDQAFLDQIKQKLEAERQKIVAMLEKHGVKNPDDPAEYDPKYTDIGDEEEDNAHEIEEFQVTMNTEELLETKLRDIDAALARLADGTYGICKYTNEPIEKERLLARPTSTASLRAKEMLAKQGE